jgi:hypothetical protein
LRPPELGFLKAKDGEPVFGEPWHVQTLALADLLVQRGSIAPKRWAEALGAEIAALKAEPDDRETYFRAALAALVRLLAENGAVTRAELDERESQWEREPGAHEEPDPRKPNYRDEPGEDEGPVVA